MEDTFGMFRTVRRPPELATRNFDVSRGREKGDELYCGLCANRISSLNLIPARGYCWDGKMRVIKVRRRTHTVGWAIDHALS